MKYIPILRKKSGVLCMPMKMQHSTNVHCFTINLKQKSCKKNPQELVITKNILGLVLLIITFLCRQGHYCACYYLDSGIVIATAMRGTDRKQKKERKCRNDDV